MSVCSAGGPGSPERLHSLLAGTAWCAAGPSPLSVYLPRPRSPDGVVAQTSPRICGCILFSGFSVFEDNCSTVFYWFPPSACISHGYTCAPPPRPRPAPWVLTKRRGALRCAAASCSPSVLHTQCACQFHAQLALPLLPPGHVLILTVSIQFLLK